MARLGERVCGRESEGEGVYHRLPDGGVGQPFSERERGREKEWRTTMTKAMIVNAGYD